MIFNLFEDINLNEMNTSLHEHTMLLREDKFELSKRYPRSGQNLYTY